MHIGGEIDMKFPKPLAVSIFSYCLVFTFSHLVAHAAEIEVAGYAKAVVTATRGKPMVKVSDGGDGSVRYKTVPQ